MGFSLGYPERNLHTPYCPVWPVQLYSALEHYLKMARFGGKCYWTKNVIDTKFYWTQNFFEQKMFLNKNVFEQKIFLNRKSFWTKMFLNRKFYWHKMFWTQNVFEHKMFLNRKFFWTENVFEQKCFWTQNVIEHKMFLNRKFFWTENFIDTKCFWTQNFFEQKCFWTQNVIGHKMCVLIFSVIFVWNCTHSTNNRARYNRNVFWPFKWNAVILVRLQWVLNFLGRFYKNPSSIESYQNPSSGGPVAPGGRTDRRTDMTKLTVALRNFANASKNAKISDGTNVDNISSMAAQSRPLLLPTISVKLNRTNRMTRRSRTPLAARFSFARTGTNSFGPPQLKCDFCCPDCI